MKKKHQKNFRGKEKEKGMETDNSSSSSMSGVSLVAKNNLLAESKAQGPKTNANIEY